nr:Gp19/Gp15/Gp42 family protein [uncultured Olsenella sp.]
MFATPDDYEQRYGMPGDVGLLAAILEDAENTVLSAYESHWGLAYEKGDHPDFDRSAKSVCCLLANQVLSAPTTAAGATQYSQGAGGYTASVTYANGLGRMFLGRSELKSLGLDGQVVRSMRPAMGGGR